MTVSSLESLFVLVYSTQGGTEMTDKDEKLEESEWGKDRASEDQAKRGAFKFKVNGVEIETPQRYLSARQILELAKNKGAIPGDPDGYILQGEKGKYGPDDQIDLEEDYLFLTIPNKPTPVA